MTAEDAEDTKECFYVLKDILWRKYNEETRENYDFFFFFIVNMEEYIDHKIQEKKCILEKIVTMAQIWPHFYVKSDIYIYIHAMEVPKMRIFIRSVRSARFGRFTYHENSESLIAEESSMKNCFIL